MLQGTWLGPLAFIILAFILLINDLSSDCGMQKLVDDVTPSEVIKKHDYSNMSTYPNNVVEWSDHNLMDINVAKTKKMLLGRINKEPSPNIFVSSNVIERVSSYLFQGVISFVFYETIKTIGCLY